MLESTSDSFILGPFLPTTKAYIGSSLVSRWAAIFEAFDPERPQHLWNFGCRRVGRQLGYDIEPSCSHPHSGPEIRKSRTPHARWMRAFRVKLM